MRGGVRQDCLTKYPSRSRSLARCAVRDDQAICEGLGGAGMSGVLIYRQESSRRKGVNVMPRLRQRPSLGSSYSTHQRPTPRARIELNGHEIVVFFDTGNQPICIIRLS